MSAFPVPSDERLRLRALDRLEAFDAPADQFTDAIAIAAAALVGAPMGAVTLVGQHAMRLKGSVGLGAGDVPRTDAFCSHAIMGPTPFVVSDLRLDDRFAANAMVVGAPYARFYAGFPMVVEGRSIGAVCVIDDRPRTLSRDQIAGLKRLARGAAAWFALRQGAPEGAE